MYVLSYCGRLIESSRTYRKIDIFQGGGIKLFFITLIIGKKSFILKFINKVDNSK